MGSYDFETGLSDDFTLQTSPRPYFAYTTKLSKDGTPRVALHLEGKAEGGTYEEPVELAGETSLLFSVGDKWMIVDDGARLVHESGADRAFNVKSAIVRLIKSAIEAGVPLKDRGDATEAKIWADLTLHFKRFPENMGGEIGTVQVLKVDKYLGANTGGASPAPVAKTAPAASSNGADDLEFVKSSVGGPIVKRLEKFAAESVDYDSFAAEAIVLPKISDSKELQAVFLDEARGAAVWEALKAGA